MTITPKQYAQAWFELLCQRKKDEQEKTMALMLKYLYQRGLLSYLPKIMEHIEDLEQKQSGIENVAITSARELDANFVKKTVHNLLKTKETRLTKHIDPNIIGGVRIETKNKRWDLTIRNQLKSLENALTR